MLRLVALGVAAAYLAATVYTAAVTESEMWVAMVCGPVLVAISWPILSWISRRVGAPWLLPVASIALVLKLGASIARWWVAFAYYGGSADAARYDTTGAAIADQIQQGRFPALGQVGTPFIETVTGVVYSLSVPSIYVGYLVFAWLGFWGLLLTVLAYMTAFPDGNARRYAYLVLFLPSLLFWPSGLGKEAWMMLGVGLAMYGAARLLAGRITGATWLVLGLLATSMVRPHVTALLVSALFIAVLVRPARELTPLTPLVKAVGIVAASALFIAALRSAATFVGVDEFTPDGIQEQLETRTSNTERGGSEFEGAFTTSITGIPWALVTVILRPFPWEAGGLLPLLSAMEGMLLLFLIWRFGKPILRLPRYLRRHPYVTFCVSYVLFYAVLFSGFSNFGILVRQRSLVLPAFLVLLALPALTRPRPLDTEVLTAREGAAPVVQEYSR